MKVQDALTRFSDRVDDYIKYRPGYPAEVLEILRNRCGLNRQSVIADIGSGPGNFARLFVENGNEVFAVEPNAEMRVAGQQLLGRSSTYHSVAGKAEETHLPDVSVDFITAAQAFHWFDWPLAKLEFRRVLRPGGWVVLVWNDRRFESSPFQRDYEEFLLQFGTDYAHVKSQGKASVDLISDFFSGHFEKVALDTSQRFDFEALKGRLFSASYAPQAGHPNHKPMLRELQNIFQRHVKDGKVAFEYDTNMYFGQLQ
jgi:SAM-dependent methyltransferase